MNSLTASAGLCRGSLTCTACNELELNRPFPQPFVWRKSQTNLKACLKVTALTGPFTSLLLRLIALFSAVPLARVVLRSMEQLHGRPEELT